MIGRAQIDAAITAAPYTVAVSLFLNGMGVRGSPANAALTGAAGAAMTSAVWEYTYNRDVHSAQTKYDVIVGSAMVSGGVAGAMALLR